MYSRVKWSGKTFARTWRFSINLINSSTILGKCLDRNPTVRLAIVWTTGMMSCIAREKKKKKKKKPTELSASIIFVMRDPPHVIYWRTIQASLTSSKIGFPLPESLLRIWFFSNLLKTHAQWPWLSAPSPKWFASTDSTSRSPWYAMWIVWHATHWVQNLVVQFIDTKTTTL